jgi:hypothetical protein
VFAPNASLSGSTGAIALAIDTQPVSLLQFDGRTWTSSELSGPDIMPESLRLYTDSAGQLRAAALTRNDPATLVVFSEDNAWVGIEEPFNLALTEGAWAIAGGIGSASLWFREDTGWQLLSDSGVG